MEDLETRLRNLEGVAFAGMLTLRALVGQVWQTQTDRDLVSDKLLEAALRLYGAEVTPKGHAVYPIVVEELERLFQFGERSPSRGV